VSFSNFVRSNTFTNPYRFKNMSVEFKMIPKKNMLSTTPDVKYYPCAISQGEINLDDLARIIASRTTMSKADCYGVVIALSDVISESLKQGKIVRIDDLGTFRLGLLGTAATSPDALGKSNIIGTKINYTPSKNIKRKMKEITYKRLR